KNNTDRHGKSSAMKCQISETLVCWAAQSARGKPTPTAQGAPSQIISPAFREISDSATFHFCTGFVRGSLWHERSSFTFRGSQALWSFSRSQGWPSRRKRNRTRGERRQTSSRKWRRSRSHWQKTRLR